YVACSGTVTSVAHPDPAPTTVPASASVSIVPIAPPLSFPFALVLDDDDDDDLGMPHATAATTPRAKRTARTVGWFEPVMPRETSRRVPARSRFLTRHG